MLKISAAYKIVLSGLSENSWGAGTYKRTVWHALVTEDYQNGRMLRKKGDFLCSPKSRPFDTGFISNTSDRVVEINCTGCKKILAGKSFERKDIKD